VQERIVYVQAPQGYYHVGPADMQCMPGQQQYMPREQTNFGG